MIGTRAIERGEFDLPAEHRIVIELLEKPR